jgi:hypothetical protein
MRAAQCNAARTRMYVIVALTTSKRYGYPSTDFICFCIDSERLLFFIVKQLNEEGSKMSFFKLDVNLVILKANFADMANGKLFIGDSGVGGRNNQSRESY